MVNKKLATLACIVFAVGLIIGLLSLNTDLRNYSKKEYPVEANLIYAYFKVYNTSADSGIAYNRLLSYVLVLNVTNPSDTTLRLSNIRIDTSGTNIFSYERAFSAIDKYNFNANTSHLIDLSQTSGLDNLSGEPFTFPSFQIGFTVAATFTPEEGNGHGGDVSDVQAVITRISQDEYVYGTFNQSIPIIFSNDNGFVSAWPVTGRVR
jgi:hypothetical protein